MEKKLGLLARLVAKSGQEQAVATFLTQALPLATAEGETLTWYAAQLDSRTFYIFDTFPHEAARQAHLSGPIASSLMAHADELFAEAPDIQPITVLAAK